MSRSGIPDGPAFFFPSPFPLYDKKTTMVSHDSRRVHGLRWAGLGRLSRAEAGALRRLAEFVGQVAVWGRLEERQGSLSSVRFHAGAIRIGASRETVGMLAGFDLTWAMENKAGRRVVLAADVQLAASMAALAAGQSISLVPRPLSQVESVVATAVASDLVFQATHGGWHMVEACRRPEMCRLPEGALALFEFSLELSGNWGRAVALFDLSESLGGFQEERSLRVENLGRLTQMLCSGVLRSPWFGMDARDVGALEVGALVLFGVSAGEPLFVLEAGGVAWNVAVDGATGDDGVSRFSVVSVASGERVVQREDAVDEFGDQGLENGTGSGEFDKTDVSGVVGDSEMGAPTQSLVDSGRLQGMTLDAVVELGRVRLPVIEVLGLTVGSVVELDRPIQETADLRVGGKLVAQGRLVDIEGKLGLQITEVFE